MSDIVQKILKLILTIAIVLVPYPIEPLRAQAPGQSGAVPSSNLRTIYIAGDSTAANGNADAMGWGKHLGSFFDPLRTQVVNLARGGRSSRTFVSEGLWDSLLQKVQPGDIVLIQFGHNDGGPVDRDKSRGSLPGIGDESKEVKTASTKSIETVQTFGAYLRKMITDAKAKQAYPIVLSLTVRNEWKEGKVERGAGSGRFGEWSREVAKQEKVPFVDVTEIIADAYEMLGQEPVKRYFPKDHTHTNEEGAKLNANWILTGLKGLRDQAILGCLNIEGRVAATATPDQVMVGPRIGPRDSLDSAGFQRWLNVPLPADPSLPTLYLIGDSTVRTGRGDGDNGQFGWGDPLEAYFDLTKINVVNRALGGTGAGSFRKQGTWDDVLKSLKKGDVVVMQFGHNDNGSRGALPGMGEESMLRENPITKQSETVHTFGWYLRQYIDEVRAQGATPIVCSLIPRNVWKDGKIVRTRDSHADWARSVAESKQADFIDLYEIISTRYDALGAEAVMPLFADKRVHTSWKGAELNAKCVIEGLGLLKRNPLNPYFKSN